MKIHQNLEKIRLGPRYLFLFALIIFAIIFMGTITPVNSAHIEEDDPEDDVYEISGLDFLYTIGEDFPNERDEDEITDLIDRAVERSEGGFKRPKCINIKEVIVNTDDPNWTVVVVEMYGDIKDCDYVRVLGFMEDEDDDWVAFKMEYDDGSEDYDWESEDNDNDTVGGCSGDQIGLAFPSSECNWKEDDTLIVVAFTYTGKMSSPSELIVYYDIYPNSLAPETHQGIYQGWDPITQFLSEVAEFLFGWFLPYGFLPFLLLIALFIALGQIFMDRKSRILHYIGMAFLLFNLWPILWYSVDLNLVGVLGLPDAFAILTLFSLLFFAGFIGFSIANNFGVIKKYRIFYSIALILMLSIEIIYLLIFMNSVHIINMFILTGICITLYIALKISKMYGRNKVK